MLYNQVKKAGTAYFPAGDSIICSTLAASASVSSRQAP